MGNNIINQTPAPALTWTHLFPSAAAYECSGGPEWFRQKLATLPSHAAPSVQVLWNDGSAVMERAAACDGVVAINCRKFPAEQLRAAGYTYLRHFAVLPSLRNARWLVPLDSPAVASAGLSLYTPARISARAKRGAIRLAMQTRLPIWYRDHIWIAQRQPPPIEAAVNPLFPGQEVRWALSSGAPEGARNRKASALVIAPDGTLLAFVKLACSNIARRIINREAAVLEHLGKLPALAGSVPQMLFGGAVDDVRVLVQKPLPGKPASADFSDAHQHFLTSLQTPLTVNAASTSIATGLLARFRALPTLRTDLIEICARVLDELGEFDVPMTIIHGDFAPWNLRIDQGRISAFDWEYGEIHGLPLIDEIHYRLQCGWLLEDWNTQEALACLDEIAEQCTLDLEPRQVETISTVYLLDALARLLAEGYDDDQDVISWHQRLLDCLTFRATHSRLEGQLV